MKLAEMRHRLSEVVLNQPELVKSVTSTIHRHLYNIDTNFEFHTSNSLLIIGDTGTGKTFSVKELAKLVDLPFIEINAKSICQEGWNG